MNCCYAVASLLPCLLISIKEVCHVLGPLSYHISSLSIFAIFLAAKPFDGEMHLHSRISDTLWDQQRPNALYNLRLKALKSRPETKIYPFLSEPPFIEALKSFPGRLSGELCWNGPVMGNDTSSYLVNFSLEDVSEFEVAMHRFKGR